MMDNRVSAIKQVLAHEEFGNKVNTLLCVEINHTYITHKLILTHTVHVQVCVPMLTQEN